MDEDHLLREYREFQKSQKEVLEEAKQVVQK